jgi:hypothetical protein
MTATIIVIAILLIGYFVLSSSSKKREIVEVNTSQSDGPKTPEKTKKRKSGKFDVVGYHHLADDVKRIVWKELKEGDSLELVADPNNKYDNEAVKVVFKGNQIGWVTKQYYRKDELFDCLMKGIEVKVKCTSKRRRQDYRRASRPDKDGNWDDKYLGMAQFVEASFAINYQPVEN